LISFNTKLDENLKKRLTIIAAKTGISIQQLVGAFIEEGLSKMENKKVPNVNFSEND
jgi:predicted HicB family RNase H-like nuclease